eukprot:12014072-Prorocentrum_lima.AAC.1
MELWCWSVTVRCAAAALLARQGTSLQDSACCSSWQAAVRHRESKEATTQVLVPPPQWCFHPLG